MGDLVLCFRRSINISYRVKCTKCFSDTTSFSSIHGTHIFVLKVPSTLMGRCCWKKLWGEGVKVASPCLGYPRKGRKRAVSALQWRRCCPGRLEPGPPAPNLPPANKETLPCSKPQFLHWLKEEAPLVQSLPSLGVPGSQKASSLFLTYRRYHFLEDLARCGPPGVSLLGQRAKILTRLRRGFGTGPVWENRKDDEPDSPSLLLGVVYSSFPSAEFSGSIVTLDISAGAWPLAPGHLTHLSITELME